MKTRILVSGVVSWVVLGAAVEARADEPLALRASWAGSVDFFSTGAPLATDSDNDGKVDMPAQPGMVTVSALEVPALATLEDAFLYWGGTQDPVDCMDPANIDSTVTFTPPAGAPTEVIAEVCYCSGSMTYDMQLCRTEITDLLTVLPGPYAVDGFDALIGNADTHNASFAVVLVYSVPLAQQRRIALYDGLQGLVQGGVQTTTLVLDNLNVDTPPQGDLTFYALEGDATAGTNEFVEVTSLPAGGTTKLMDANNPVNNPFNRTINTTMPPQNGVTGVDIDRFTLTGILDAADTELQIKYSAGLDKYWVAFNMVAVDVFEPVFSNASSKSWVLTDDMDGDGQPSAGDLLTYTIHLENTGTAAGTTTLTDEIPLEVDTWQLIDDGGGTDMSAGDTLMVSDITLTPNSSTDIVLEVVLADVPDLTSVINTANLDGDGGPAALVAPEIVVRRDGDGDTVYDSDDNCPDVENQGQEDEDMDDIGDACEDPPETTGTETDTDATAGSDTEATDESAGETAGATDTTLATGDETFSGTAPTDPGPTDPSGGSGTGGLTTGGNDETGGNPSEGSPTDNGNGEEEGDEDSEEEGGQDTVGQDDGGCSCRETGRMNGAWLLLTLAGLGLGRRRRR
jgi:uncharacterized repeat protein (TIGR01451 family)